MTSQKSVEDQLKRLDFKVHGWGRAEIKELQNILMPDEEIYELVNGIYEGGFALLLATDVRMMLVDRKPLNYLTVEDLRFDMINEIDYSHRLLGAQITVSSGSKTMRFRSYNQQRLRKVITHVQHCMAEAKKQESQHQEGQRTHLEQINQQLQSYLVAQHQQQEQLWEQLQKANGGGSTTTQLQPVQPSRELADYLYAQGILAEYRRTQGGSTQPVVNSAAPDRIEQPPVEASSPAPPQPSAISDGSRSQMADLYAEGMQEVFGKRQQAEAVNQAPAANTAATDSSSQAAAGNVSEPASFSFDPLGIGPLRIANSKLPMALRNRKFGRPSFRPNSTATEQPQAAR